MKHISITIFILIIALHFTHTNKVCNSIDIKHEKDLEKLRDCTTVAGHVRLTNFRLFDTDGIASSLEEITDYLIVYRVEGLETLENIFSNLTIIRGHKLLFDKYSLVIYENRNIRDLGLKSLLKIREGLVQIESNPVLCFADTVNWVHLLEDISQQHYSLKDNKEPNECPLCLATIRIPETEYLKNGCWNLQNFQRKKPIPHLNDCPVECGNNGCSTDRKCCSPLCLTGCFAENCRICKHFKNFEGKCVASCNIPFLKLADKCITNEECYKRGFIPHAGACISECPRGYKQAMVSGLVQCNLDCERNFTIQSKDDLEDVKGCIIIRGSLHIQLKDDKTKIIGDLENAFGELKEITGNLRITDSPQIVSLRFFKKLDTIKGEELIDNEISFYVVDNFHLEEIWAENHKVAILKGRIFFHLNPRLCYDKILELAPSIRSLNNGEIKVKDASRNSNGERVICGSQIHKINPVVDAINATAVRIKVTPLTYYEKDLVLGYLHYYKEAPLKNVTMFDGRHGCGRDNWRMEMTLNRNIRHLILNLRPYTQYAYFVKTLAMMDYHSKNDWCSDIGYFRTLPMKPGPIRKMYSTPLSGTTIIVHWWPPKHPNGVIVKYYLRYEPINRQLNHSQVFGYKSNTKNDRECECGEPREDHKPPPNDLNYYNRDQVIVDEAIPNLIFISSKTIKRLEEEQRIEDNTRRKREKNESSSEDPNTTETTDTVSKKNIQTEEQAKIDEEKAGEMRLRLHMEELEKKAILQQDTGEENYRIESPKPICTVTEPSIQYQEMNNCTPLENYEHGIEIPAKMHSLTLDNLQPDMTYRISIRACVDKLENPCGPEVSIEVQTVSKSLEYILKSP